MEIGIFWIPKTLTFKRRLRAKPFLWKCVLFEWEWKFFVMSMASHLASLWNRGMGQLRKACCLAKVQKSCKNITFAALVSGLHRYPVVMYMKIQWHNFKRKLLSCIIIRYNVSANLAFHYKTVTWIFFIRAWCEMCILFHLSYKY